MEKKMGRRGFFKTAGSWSLAAAGVLTGCGRIGFEPPSPTELPRPEAQGLVSRSAESLYWPHEKEGAAELMTICHLHVLECAHGSPGAEQRVAL